MMQAIRFGELPENGRSINFLASEFDDGGELTSAVYEAGVSVFRMKDGRADIEIETFRQLRSALNRLRGEAYIAEGEELPQKGADGEPLLADAKIVRPLTAEEMAGIKEQLHGVLRMNYWSETESGVKNRIASGPSSAVFDGHLYLRRISDRPIRDVNAEYERLAKNMPGSDRQALKEMFDRKFVDGERNVPDLLGEKRVETDLHTLITHGGIFHPDDVLAAAFLRELNPDLEVKRVFRVPDEIPEGALVADIGGGRYDHHQADAFLREDGHKHAAVGLVVKDYAGIVFENGIPRGFEEEIRRVEDVDNGVPAERSDLISCLNMMNPAWDSGKSTDEAFEEAVAFAGEHFVHPYVLEDRRVTDRSVTVNMGEHREAIMRKLEELQKESEASKERAAALVQEAYRHSDGSVVPFPQFAPWQDVLTGTKAVFVTYPSIRGGYNLQAVPLEPESFEKKVPLPEKWLSEKPEGASFVHPGLFLANFDTEKHAVDAARGILREKIRGIGEDR